MYAWQGGSRRAGGPSTSFVNSQMRELRDTLSELSGGRPGPAAVGGGDSDLRVATLVPAPQGGVFFQMGPSSGAGAMPLPPALSHRSAVLPLPSGSQLLLAGAMSGTAAPQRKASRSPTASSTGRLSPRAASPRSDGARRRVGSPSHFGEAAVGAESAGEGAGVASHVPAPPQLAGARPPPPPPASSAPVSGGTEAARLHFHELQATQRDGETQDGSPPAGPVPEDLQAELDALTEPLEVPAARDLLRREGTLRRHYGRLRASHDALSSEHTTLQGKHTALSDALAQLKTDHATVSTGLLASQDEAAYYRRYASGSGDQVALQRRLIDDLRAALAGKEAALEALHEEVARANARYASAIKSAPTQAQHALGLLSAEAHALRGEVAAQRALASSAAAERDAEVRRLTLELERSGREAGRLHELMGALRAQSDDNTRRWCDDLGQVIKEAEALRREGAAQRSEIDGLLGQVAVRDGRVHELEEQLHSAGAHSDALTAEVARLARDVADLSSAMRGMKAEGEALGTQLREAAFLRDQYRAENDLLLAEVAAAKRRAGDAADARDALAARADALHRERDGLQGEVNSLSTARNVALERLSVLQGEVSAKAAELSRVGAELAAASSERAAAQASTAELAAEVARLHASVTSLAAEVEGAQGEAARGKAEAEEARAEGDLARLDLAGARSRATVAESRYADALAREAALQARRAELEEALAALAAERAALQGQVEAGAAALASAEAAHATELAAVLAGVAGARAAVEEEVAAVQAAASAVSAELDAERAERAAELRQLQSQLAAALGALTAEHAATEAAAAAAHAAETQRLQAAAAEVLGAAEARAADLATQLAAARVSAGEVAAKSSAAEAALAAALGAKGSLAAEAAQLHAAMRRSRQRWPAPRAARAPRALSMSKPVQLQLQPTNLLSSPRQHLRRLHLWLPAPRPPPPSESLLASQ